MGVADSGQLGEIWFDVRAEQLQAFICEGLSSPCAAQGGYGGDVAPKIRQLLKQQKMAVGFGGSGKRPRDRWHLMRCLFEL